MFLFIVNDELRFFSALSQRGQFTAAGAHLNYTIVPLAELNTILVDQSAKCTSINLLPYISLTIEYK